MLADGAAELDCGLVERDVMPARGTQVEMLFEFAMDLGMQFSREVIQDEIRYRPARHLSLPLVSGASTFWMLVRTGGFRLGHHDIS